MKLSAQEEYGLRCLLHLARCEAGHSMTIPEISQLEGLSVPNVAKLMRLLRMGKLVTSVRGQAGGYTLARPAADINVAETMEILGGQFFSPQFCDRYSGQQKVCMHAVDCSFRALWTSIQVVLQELLGKTTLADLLQCETDMNAMMEQRARECFPMLASRREQGTDPELRAGNVPG
jgi:Rrf2 family protein